MPSAAAARCIGPATQRSACSPPCSSWSSSVTSLPLLSPRAISFTILGAAGALSAVGLFQARCPRVRRVAIAIDELPEGLEGYRIVQWSDVHVGPTIQRRFVAGLVERTNALGADAIAITGDLVDAYVDEVR